MTYIVIADFDFFKLFYIYPLFSCYSSSLAVTKKKKTIMESSSIN